MCGLVGVFTKKNVLSVAQEKFFNNAITAGTVRGVDSTGVIYGKSGDAAWYIKDIMTGGHFVEKAFDATDVRKEKFNYIVGHNRAATVGAITADTAHPFQEGDILGMHNGTLHSGWQTDLEGDASLGVDSQALFNTINKVGIDKAIEQANGAIAIMYRDNKDKEVYVYRNSARPLHYAVSGDTTYVASEKSMLLWLLERNKLTYHTVGSFLEDTLYKIVDGAPVILRVIKSTNTPVYSGYFTGASRKHTHHNSSNQSGNSSKKNGGHSGKKDSSTASALASAVSYRNSGANTYALALEGGDKESPLRGNIYGLTYSEASLLSQLVSRGSVGFTVMSPILTVDGNWAGTATDVTVDDVESDWLKTNSTRCSALFANNFSTFSMNVWELFVQEVDKVVEQEMCSVCGIVIPEEDNYFSTASGGVVACSTNCTEIAKKDFNIHEEFLIVVQEKKVA